jgi:phospholipid transport system substrate-binding protein
MNCRGIIRIFGLSVFLTLGISIPHLGAATPMEEIKTTADQVMKILNEPKLKGESNKSARREKLRQVILPRFDFAEMGKRALGRHWSRNPEKQSEFVEAFQQLLEDSYAEQIEGAKGDKVVYINERTEQGFAEVNTKVISPNGEETPVNYKLHRVGSDWKVYDVVIANVSLVNNYRSQFNRLLANGSLDELIKRIKEKRIQKAS